MKLSDTRKPNIGLVPHQVEKDGFRLTNTEIGVVQYKG